MPELLAAPLLLTDDETLRAEVVRLAAAAGVAVDVVGGVAEAAHAWVRAPVVLVGADLAEQVAAASPVRRPDVLLVSRCAPADALYRSALGCGAAAVLELPLAAARLVDLLTDAGDGRGATGTVVAVLGGQGGAGASTLASALALVVAARTSTALVDLDAHGAGVDQVLGLDHESGVRWDALARSVGRLSARSLRDALPRCDRLAVLGWPTDRSFDLSLPAAREVMSAARRGFDAVVVDLPRQRDPIGEEVLAQCDHVVLVSTVSVPAASAAARTAARLPRPVGQVVLRGRSSAAGAAEFERLLGAPVVARMADQRGLDEAISLGLGPLRSRHGPLARAAGRVADQVLGPR